jgi:hypothetical protein
VQPACYSARAMRRLVLVFMMCLLPLQWSWAAAASLCAHEAGGSHYGHHEHKHDACASSSQDAEESADTQRQGAHPDCQVCHGLGAACMAAQVKMAHAWADNGPPPSHDGHLPDPPVESFLRPPLSFVA